MRPSPLHTLLSRRICTCSTRKAFYPASRSISSTASCHQSARYPSPNRGPFEGGFGSAERLKRQYQYKPPLSRDERAKAFRRIQICLAGVVLCAGGMYYVILTSGIHDPDTGMPVKLEKRNGGETSFDAAPSLPGVFSAEPESDVHQVPTGTSTIPTFPSKIYISSLSPPASASIIETGEQEYQLVGLGIRTVSFLGIQVYVVGLYIAVPDIANLQERLIREIDPVATTLVPGERKDLKNMLLDPDKGEELWNSVLKDGSIRTVFRIVPTRNTDFMHLRDGWVRGITARTQNYTARGDASFDTADFGKAVNDFKAIWGAGVRKNVPKGETLLLTRDAQGRMAALYEDKKGGSLRLGGLDDERISRLIWLGYLAGKTVSSEGARQSIVDGVMEFVQRPVGTVATQVT